MNQVATKIEQPVAEAKVPRSALAYSIPDRIGRLRYELTFLHCDANSEAVAWLGSCLGETLTHADLYACRLAADRIVEDVHQIRNEIVRLCETADALLPPRMEAAE